MHTDPKNKDDIRYMPKLSGFKLFKSRFSKWSIEICDAKYPLYGGHTHWISSFLDVDYLYIGLCFKVGHWHDYYDGQHHSLYMGIFYISWGGRPFTDM